VSATSRILGRITGGAGDVEELTGANVITISGALTAANNLSDVSVAATARTNLGLVAIAASGSASDLSTGTLAAARMPALTGDVTTSVGTVATTIANAVVTFAMMATAAIATTAQFLANTASKILSTDQVWAAAVPVTLADGATVTPDFSLGINFVWTIGATGRTLADPTNMKVGQTGVIYLVQDGTGSRTITTYGSKWLFSGGTEPTLTAAAGAVDVLSYAVKSSTQIVCFFTANMS